MFENLKLRLLPCASLLVFGLFFVAGLRADEALLRYGDFVVTVDDLKAQVEMSIPDEAQTTFWANNKKIREKIGELYVLGMLAKEAKEIKLDESAVLVNQLKLREAGFLARQYLQKLYQDAEKPDFERAAREAYEVNKDKYRIEEQVSAAHILVKIKEDRDDGAAKKLAEEVRQKALGSESEAFAQLAEQFSDDPSVKVNKGSLGFFSRRKMVEPFAESAFAMTEYGQVSDVVKTRFGYHIIRFEGRKPGGFRVFDEVKEALVDKQLQKFRNNLRTVKISELRSYDGIVINDQLINSLGQNPDE